MTLTFGTEDHSTQQQRHFRERGGKRRDGRTSPEPHPCREIREQKHLLLCLCFWCASTQMEQRNKPGEMAVLCCRGGAGGSGTCTARSVQPSSSPGDGISPASCPGGRGAPWHQHLPCLTGPGFHLCPQKGCEYSKKLKRGMIKAPQLPRGGQ